jgi:ficolin
LIRFGGAWWYRSCYHSNLNGKFYTKDEHILTTKQKDGIAWNSWLGNKYSLKSVEMKIILL